MIEAITICFRKTCARLVRVDGIRLRIAMVQATPLPPSSTRPMIAEGGMACMIDGSGRNGLRLLLGEIPTEAIENGVGIGPLDQRDHEVQVRFRDDVEFGFERHQSFAVGQ